MVTIVTEIQLKAGSEPEWDQVMRERMSAARKAPGCIGGQLLRPANEPLRRVIVGTWRSRDDWKAWHTDQHFQDTRSKLDRLVQGPEDHAWHDVVLEMEATRGRKLAS